NKTGYHLVRVNPQRDFTINSLAVAFDPQRAGLLAPYQLIDPTAGAAALRQAIVRHCSDRAFVDDPLRLLRAYRFMAELDFRLAPETEDLLRAQAMLIGGVAGERLAHELQLIMASPRACATVRAMARSRLLEALFPELAAGRGMKQPSCHHLDVFDHCLEALCRMEEIQEQPARFFPDTAGQVSDYLAAGANAALLKWAALLHDIGKPGVRSYGEGGRIIFHGHDRLGGELGLEVAGRLRWSRQDTRRLAQLIRGHMRPHHLHPVLSKGRFTPRAALRLVKELGEDVVGVFVLAMADSLATAGPGKPPVSEEGIAALHAAVIRCWQQRIRPVLSRPRLLSGHDIMALFDLAPGPLVGKITAELERAEVAGEVTGKEEAREWVADYLERVR
ncbi:MAG: HD domain-containing protein, partial [Desulfobacteraceae bacterium]